MDKAFMARGTLQAAAPIVTALSATPVGQATLVLFGVGFVVLTVGYTAEKIYHIVKDAKREKAHRS